jgi:hypothetical protein
MSGIDQRVLKAENYELSDEDLMRITDNKTKILLYSDLEQVNDIDEILEPYGCCIILYQLEANVGHWCCVMKHNNQTLEFFDPYGLEIDEELKYSKYNLRKHNGEVVPHLTALIEKSNYNVNSNKVKLQEFKEHVNTCGRWVGMRIRFKDISIKKFIDLFTDNKCYDGDWFVSAMTLLV